MSCGSMKRLFVFGLIITVCVSAKNTRKYMYNMHVRVLYNNVFCFFFTAAKERLYIDVPTMYLH